MKFLAAVRKFSGLIPRTEGRLDDRHPLLQQVDLADRCVDGITADEQRCLDMARSSPAIVSIQLDLNPAAVTSVAAYGGGVNQVQVQFNKQLDPATATNRFTYSINTLSINRATLSANGTLVTLFTSQQQNLQTNKLYISGLLDYAAQPHVLNTNVTFQSGISYYQETLVDNPVRYFRFDETNGPVVNSDIVVLD